MDFTFFLQSYKLSWHLYFLADYISADLANKCRHDAAGGEPRDPSLST
jgi:hypothetical protein